jgi:TM2 domain-containing membrane protein YozV
MSHEPNFCSNCGEKLNPYVELRNCPKCDADLKSYSASQPSTSSVERLPYKNPGTTALLAFIGGILALPGIGHIYVGKVGTGVGILIGGFILYALTFTIIISVTSTRAYEAQYSPTGNASPLPMDMMVAILVLVIGYIVLFVCQLISATRLANKFNSLAKTTGTDPW